MRRQPELLSQSAFQIKPATGRDEPRLWIRRLVIWGDTDAEPIRDISLRPGLNIIWSPDGTELTGQDETSREAMGHGGGKTLLCRLIRYCLGEPRFASEDQRNRIAEVFPEGAVGAEIMLEGKLWSVVRPFAPRRKHLAVPDVSLEQALEDGAAAGIEPFLNAVSSGLFPNSVAELIPGVKNIHDVWLVALAWLTRDQECRLHHVLDWRSTESDSDSPARSLGKSELLDALRTFIQALDPEEQALRKKIAEHEAKRRSVEQERDHLAWQSDRERARLASALDVDEKLIVPGSMSALPLSEAAKQKLETAAKLKPEQVPSDIARLRQLRDEAQNDWMQLVERQSAIDAKLPEIERLIARIRSEVPGLSYNEHDAENPACPVCDVPIDRLLATQCGLSHKLPDLQTVRQRREKAQQDLDSEKATLAALRAEKQRAMPDIALARQKLDGHNERLRTLETTRDARESAWYTARKLVDDVTTYSGALELYASAVTDVRDLDSALEKLREQVAGFRDKQASVFAKLTEKFDGVIRELIGPTAKGTAMLSGKGLDLRIELGGTRSTAAIESLKIIAFDLAVLALSIEGRAIAPEFFVHDSPREADMGGPLYHRIFDFARMLEGVGSKPLFQYIITTTSKPPDDMAQAPWLRLELKGFPSDQRLLRCDL